MYLSNSHLLLLLWALKCALLNKHCPSHILQVVVTLDYNEDFQSLHNNEHVYQAVTKELTVPANDALTAHFWIIPTKIGVIDITVRAQSSSAADALRRPLIVDVS